MNKLEKWREKKMWNVKAMTTQEPHSLPDGILSSSLSFLSLRVITTFQSNILLQSFPSPNTPRILSNHQEAHTGFKFHGLAASASWVLRWAAPQLVCLHTLLWHSVSNPTLQRFLRSKVCDYFRWQYWHFDLKAIVSWYNSKPFIFHNLSIKRLSFLRFLKTIISYSFSEWNTMWHRTEPKTCFLNKFKLFSESPLSL